MFFRLVTSAATLESFYMNHPTHEEWMSHLYGELPPPRRSELDAHLAQCAECRATIAQWRATTQQLDTWKLPAMPPAQPEPRSVLPVLKWAAAAAVVFALGFLAAPAQPTPVATDTGTVRREVQRQVRKEVETQMAAFAEAYAARQATDRQALVDILRKVEAERLADYTALRKDLETVAVVAENQLDYTQQQLGQLASVTRPLSPSPSPTH
jgi:anti-sigma factor RsiW